LGNKNKMETPKGAGGYRPGSGPKAKWDRPVWAQGLDWEALFLRWVVSGSKLKNFLVEAGIIRDLTYKIPKRVQEKIKDWEEKAKQMNPGEVAAELVKAMPLPQADGALTVSQVSTPSAWSVINEYRRKQALSDFKTAENIRAHIKLLMGQAAQKGPDGRTISKLTPNEIHKLAQAAMAVQRMQRLSLGLSTENVGLDDPTMTAPIEKNVTPEAEPIPTFEVVMSKRGRFMTPRPRRVT
jgi:hypothetical protein